MSSGDKYRVMVVDDDEPTLNSLIEMLTPQFEATGASNGLDALEKLERYEPDLIILDVVMPCVDGIDTCRAIRKNVRFREIPVIFLTGHDETSHHERSKGLRATRFMHKPVTATQLLDCCCETLRESEIQTPTRKRLGITELESVHYDPIKHTPDSPATPAFVSDSDRTPTAERIAGDVPLAPAMVRVMIIDDDPDVIAYMLAVLRERYEVFGVHDPISAIYKIIRYQPDLIILDIAMPRLSGYQLSQLLRLNRNLRTVKVMFVSSKDTAQEIAYAKKLGAADYLVKPFAAHDLLRKVAGIVDAPDFVVREKALNFHDIRIAESADTSSSSQFF